MDGWICLHRSFLDNPLFTGYKLSYGEAWIQLLLLANHAPGKVMIGKDILEIGRGELAWSQKNLAKKWGWSLQNLRTFLKTLKTLNMVQLNSNTHTTIITICNYSKYQDNFLYDNTRVTHDQHTGNTRVTPNNKNNKNNKNNHLTNTEVSKHSSFKLPEEVVKESEVEKSEKKAKKELSPTDAKRPRAHQFNPPSLDDVTAYIAEKGYQVNATKFYSHYESNGWKVGKNPMKDWRAAVTSWSIGDRYQPNGGGGGMAQYGHLMKPQKFSKVTEQNIATLQAWVEEKKNEIGN